MTLTRRNLIAALAAAAARGATSSAGMSRLSVINDEAGMTRDETFAFAKEFGIGFLELRSAQKPKLEYVETLPGAELKDLARQLADRGLRASVLDSSLLKIVFPGTKPVSTEDFYIKYYAGLGLTDAGMYRDRMDMLKRTINAAHIVGAPKIRVFAFWRVADPRTIFRQLADHMAEMAEVAAKEKVQLLLENETSTNVATSEETAEMSRLVPSPALGINWDPQNAVALEAEPFPAGLAKLPKNRIGNVHVKAEGLFGPKHPLDWAAIMRALVEGGYQGRFSLETHRGHTAANVVWSRKCIEKMKSMVPA
jgi:sugar phosphate isomerase/epimerase